MKIFTICGAFFLAATIMCVAGCSKTGPAGPQGEPGAAGEQGPAGPQGIPGADGNIIYSGDGAPSADLGASNDYYIDKGSGELYGPKSDAGWGDPVSIKGTRGDKGDTGATGATGPAGPAGENGKDGSQILSGSSDPAASLGNTGDYYFNTETCTLYGPKTAAGWGSGIGLKGEKGDKGDKGDTGNANVISSGWFSIADNDWLEAINGGFFVHGGIAYNFNEAGDNNLIIDQNAYQIDAAHADAAILMYVKNDNGVMWPAPVEMGIALGDITRSVYDLKFRYVTLNSGADLELYPVVALRGGGTDASVAISLIQYFKWRIIVVPSSNTRRATPPDPSDYKATCAYYGIPE